MGLLHSGKDLEMHEIYNRFFFYRDEEIKNQNKVDQNQNADN